MIKSIKESCMEFSKYVVNSGKLGVYKQISETELNNYKKLMEDIILVISTPIRLDGCQLEDALENDFENNEGNVFEFLDTPMASTLITETEETNLLLEKASRYFQGEDSRIQPYEIHKSGLDSSFFINFDQYAMSLENFSKNISNFKALDIFLEPNPELDNKLQLVCNGIEDLQKMIQVMSKITDTQQMSNSVWLIKYEKQIKEVFKKINEVTAFLEKN